MANNKYFFLAENAGPNVLQIKIQTIYLWETLTIYLWDILTIYKYVITILLDRK